MCGLQISSKFKDQSFQRKEMSCSLDRPVLIKHGPLLSIYSGLFWY